MQQVTLIARLTRDLELKTGRASERRYLVANLAVNDSFDRGTIFVRLLAFDGPLADGQALHDLAADLHKGDEMVASGTLTRQQWTDTAGAKRSGWQLACTCEDIVPLSRARRKTSKADPPDV